MTFLKLSPTKAATWVDCPRKYYFAYVLKMRSGRHWAHFSFANSVHGALRDWFDIAREERHADGVDGLVSRVWSDAGFRDADQAATWRELAVRMVRRYLATLDPAFEPVSTERTLAFKEDSFVVEGRIDRLDRREGSPEGDGELVVVDYKTGKSIPGPDDVRGSQALAMYAVMVQRSLGRSCSVVALHHVPSQVQVSWTHTTQSLARHVSRVRSIASDIVLAQDTWQASEGAEPILDDLFPARPSALCGFCDFWDACPSGREFTHRREPWEGLGEVDPEA